MSFIRSCLIVSCELDDCHKLCLVLFLVSGLGEFVHLLQSEIETTILIDDTILFLLRITTCVSN